MRIRRSSLRSRPWPPPLTVFQFIELPLPGGKLRPKELTGGNAPLLSLAVPFECLPPHDWADYMHWNVGKQLFTTYYNLDRDLNSVSDYAATIHSLYFSRATIETKRGPAGALHFRCVP